MAHRKSVDTRTVDAGQNLSPRVVEAKDRALKALKLRQKGKSYLYIAEKLGYNTRQAAFIAVSRLLKQTVVIATEDARKEMLSRLDRLLEAAWPSALRGEARAIESVLRIEDRRAKLLGLDAPQKLDITQRIRILADELGLDPQEAVDAAERIISAVESD